MNSKPFDIGQIKDRLKAEVTGLREVGGAADYRSVRELGDFYPPCAYVVLTSEQGDAKSESRGRQRALVTFGVVLAVRNYRDVQGDEALDDLSPLLGQVRDALIGFKPAEQGSREIAWKAGDVIDYDDNTLLWGEVYQTQHFIGSGK